jgi:predicted SnoaL-like aldol condensation-catalyzing enzyme
MVVMMKSMGTDQKTEVVKALADDEYVMGWMHWTGVSNGTSPDMPAGPYDMRAIEVVKFKDGKATEHWTFMEPGEVMKMMQNMQQPSTNNNTNTTPGDKMSSDTTKPKM